MSRLSVSAFLVGATLSLATGTALEAQAGSPAGPVPVANLTARRNALLARMGPGVAVLRSAGERDIESDYPQDSDFRQDNDFFYLTGLETPGSYLVLQVRDSAPARVILYLPARDTAQERWTGPKLGPGPEATALTGIDDVRPADKAEAEIRGFAFTSGRRVLLKFGDRTLEDLYLRGLALNGPALKVEDLRPMLAAQRLVKDDDEIRRMRRAATISTDGHDAAIRRSVPGMWEYEIEGILEGTFRYEGAERLGYPSIVGTGIDATVLHYDLSRRQTGPNDLVVMDAAAEFGYYTADVTRTFPVNGKFSARQKALYELVLATQQAAMDSVHPGQLMGNLGRIARTYMKEHSGDLCAPKSCDAYFIHGLGHWIGMDVHDVGDYRTPLAPGMMLTIEPGIYIPAESIGIRIEDDFLVTDSGYVMMSSGAPRTVADIEKLMAAGAKERKKK
jgi:Xaa-Pro aminopeptidase